MQVPGARNSYLKPISTPRCAVSEVDQSENSAMA